MHAHARHRQVVIAIVVALATACFALSVPAARRAAAHPMSDQPVLPAPSAARTAARAPASPASALLGRIAVQAVDVTNPPPVRAATPIGLTHAFALLGNLPLVLPADDPVYIGFHEASNPQAFPLIPLGQLVVTPDSEQDFSPPTPIEDGRPYSVMASRGRGRSPASAADIVLNPGDAVHAVATGTVTEAMPYLLYGMFPDFQVRIRLADRPDVVVTMLHMTGLKVAVGQQVKAGETVIAESANQFPFVSQVDDFLGGQPHSHVHVEAAPAPGGP